MSMKRPSIPTHIHLPTDIMFDILSRLPIRAIAQCRSVCKAWYEFTTDSDFLSLSHSRISLEDPSFFIICETRFMFETFSLVDHGNLYNSRWKAFSIEFDEIDSWRKKIKVLGSSNGLICFLLLDEGIYYIFNPITRELKKLPTPFYTNWFYVSEFDRSEYNQPGFAFDAITNTYKVVHTFLFKSGDRLCCGVKIYTLGSTSRRWKRVEDIPIFTPWERTHAFLKRALHSVIRKSERNPELSDCIAAVDIATGKFKAFKTPHRECGSRALTSLGEHLCLADDKYDGIDGTVLWIMKDYGVESSWTKEHIIRWDTLGPMKSWCMKILGLKNGTVLLQDGERRGYYNLEKHKFNPIQIDGVPQNDEVLWWYLTRDLNIVVHLGSLISIKTIARRGGQQRSILHPPKLTGS